MHRARARLAKAGSPPRETVKQATHHIYMHPVPHQAFHKRHAPICQRPIRVEVQAHAGLEQEKIFLAEDGLPARQEYLCSEDLLVSFADKQIAVDA